MSFGGGFGGFGSNTNTNTNTGFGGFGSTNNTSNTTANTGAFGSTPNTFGATNTTTGGGLFGGSSSNTGGGFGSASGGFGSNTSGAFGAAANKPAFGTTASAGGGLFGSSNPASTSGTGFGGGFGSTPAAPTTTSAFGSNANSGGLFGNAANKPAFGTSATGSTGGLFGGGGTTNTFGNTGSAFNAPASTALGGPVGDAPGTATTPFTPTIEKESAASLAQNSFQNVLFQEPYKKFSAEELRLADYAQNRRFGSGAGPSFGGGFGGGFGANTNTNANTTTSAFGSTNNATSGGGLFGSSNTGSTGFGSNTANTGFGSSTSGGGLFGAKPAATGGLFGGGAANAAAPPSGGLFGSAGNTGSTGFGTNTGATSSAFGTNNAAGGGLFGAQAAKPAGTGFSFGTNTANNPATGGGGLFGNTQQQQQPQQQQQQQSTGFGASNTAGGGLFGNTQQAATNTGGGFSAATTNSSSNKALGLSSGGGLFGNQQQAKPGGLFGSSTAGNTGGGLFGNNTAGTQNNAFGTNNQQAGGLFGNKPAGTTGGGIFGNSTSTPANNQGGGLFGGQQQTQNQPGGGLFGGLNNSTQNKPGGLFGQSTQSTGGGLFGGQNNAQQGSSLFGNSTNQQPQNTLGNSIFSNSMNNQQGQQTLTASVNDPSAYGTGSLFGNLAAPSNDPGPLATPLSSKKPARKPSILPMYKLNPASASRMATPQKRGFGFSYSTYGTPNSPSSAASTPGGLSQSLIGGSSLGRSLGKSVSVSNLRRSFNVEDSLLAPGAFSASTGPRYTGGNVKKLVINRELRSDLFSTPTKVPDETTNGSRKLSKRVSFDTDVHEAPKAIDGPSASGNSTPSAEELGYIRPQTNGTNGSKAVNVEEQSTSLTIVHEEEIASPAAPSPSATAADKELGEYWMEPSKEEIQAMNRVQRQKVSNFKVGRKNSGWVMFKVPVDLTQIDIDNLYDNIIVLDIRSCTVYPNPAKKPQVGKGLNVPSLINLENSWPRAAKTRGKAAASLKKHIDRLSRIENTHFESYNESTGEWTFSVDHFTRYGLDYDDEDDEDFEADPSMDTAEPPRHDSASPSPSAHPDFDQDDITFDFRRSQHSLPGAFDAAERQDDEESVEEMAEVDGARSSFLGSRSVGSTSRALVPVAQDEMDEEYGSFEEQDASADLGRHHAAEQDEDSFAASQMEFVAETPAGIMRARMRAIKGSATPAKVTVTAGDDWMDMLQKTVSPQKRDRARLKENQEADNYRMKDSIQLQSPTKKRVVSDSRGFATSIDLMKSIFDHAKTPVEKPQPAVRPGNVKWPYKRMTKALDENDLDEKERTWHDTLRPTWGPNGTLVFAANPQATPFGRSGRITEKNGLMTVTKNNFNFESQDIRIARFSNEMSAKAIRAHTELSQIYLDNGVPTVQGPRVSLKEFATDTGAKNPAADHEKLVWELASTLFDNVKIPAELQNRPDAAERIRRESLSRFWESMVEAESNKGISMAGTSEEKALAALSGHRVAEACKHLLDGKNFRLATLVALIGTGDSVKRDMREQIREWQSGSILSEFSEPIRALYEMLSGNVCVCEGTKSGPSENRADSFIISNKFGLNWKQAFGLRLWYASSSEDAIADAVEKFKEDYEQDREQHPSAWFVEQGIGSIWDDPKEADREDLLWGLLQLYSNKHADLESILRPENSQLSPLDYRLTWQLGQALAATGKASFGNNATEKSDAATISFASQLTNEGSWVEAAFVTLHLADPDARSKAIQEHLCRHAGLIGDEQSESFRELTDKLKIPSRWIWHAKALYMRSVKKDAAGEVQCLLRSESFAEAHQTFIKEVAPVAVIERDYNALADLLQQFDGRQSQVADWNLGGEVYKAFLQLVGFQRRHEQPPLALISGLLEGLPAMHGNTPEAGIVEYAALTDMAEVVAKVVSDLAKSGKMDHQRILKLPLTEDVLLRHSRDLAWSHYHNVMAGH
ncbi:nuclear protein 96-domain-containing protein [Truncatella angustata]|uniref:Nuclear protein 96-domain-containing protein n=1 Tax=Truncatella angustata TaxID=152316 RepID=A0A9P8RJZ2_9PEZI|nr:nuclear protein 96-domain-containing protein [Truncatella angustata]KAH6647455.1 nuclear protein 96-domain-containing protein [Truncatella angustata]